MLSHDLIALSWKFAEYAGEGMQLHPKAAAAFADRFREMAADAAALERATLAPDAGEGAGNLAGDYDNVVVFNPVRRPRPAGGPQGGTAA